METFTASDVRIGIDALHLYNIGYGVVEPDLLESKADGRIVKYSVKDMECSPTASTVEYVQIIDNHMFADLTLKSVLMPYGGLRKYGDLSLTVHHAIGNNLRNLSVDEYKEFCVNVKDYVLSTYGIELDFFDAKVKSMEINATLPMSRPFCDCARMIKLLMVLIPGKEKFGPIKEYDTVLKKPAHLTDIQVIPSGYVRENGQIKFAVYDKTRELHDNDHIDVDQHLLRFEFTLKTQRKMSASFGTCLLNDLSDQMISDFFYKKIRVDYHGEYKRWHEKNLNVLRKLVDEFFKPYRPWQHALLTYCIDREVKEGCLTLLDIDDLMDIITPDKYHHRARQIAAFDRHKDIASVFFRGDRTIEPEIMSMIDIAYRNCNSGYEDGA